MTEEGGSDVTAAEGILARISQKRRPQQRQPFPRVHHSSKAQLKSSPAPAAAPPSAAAAMSAAPAQRIVGFEPVIKVQESPTTPSRLSAATTSTDLADDSVYRSLYIGKTPLAAAASREART